MSEAGSKQLKIYQNEQSGFIVAPGNCEEAAAKLRHLYNDDELRNQIGTRAKSRIQEHFTLDSMTKEYIDFYNNL